MIVETEEQLEALYAASLAHASVAKVTDTITPDYAALIAASPFAVLATSGPEGLDCSPRGDRPGFVRVADPRTLILPTGAATTGSIPSATSCATRGWRCCS